MEHSESTRFVLKTIQQARAAHDDQPRFTHAVVALMDQSPADSYIVRALQDDSVWDSSMRAQLRRHVRNPTANPGPRFDIGLRADQLMELADTYARAENALRATEFHLAKALVDRAGNMLQELGIRADALVRRVQELEGHPAERLCFVLMPFRAELTEVYTSSLRPAIEAAGLHCERADDIDHPGVVLDQIDDRIQQAFVIVADLTFLNPNVMQEMGFARRCGKPIVLLTQDSAGGLPFDVRHYRVIQYTQSESGLADLKTRRHLTPYPNFSMVRLPHRHQAYFCCPRRQHPFSAFPAPWSWNWRDGAFSLVSGSVASSDSVSRTWMRGLRRAALTLKRG